MASRRSQQKGNTGRLVLVACLLFAWMGGLIWRLAYLQINRHQELAEKARLQQTGVEPIAAFRGEIVDRRERLLASSIDADTVIADLYQFPAKAKEAAVKLLAPALRATEQDLQKQLDSGSKAPVLGRKLDAETSNNIRNILEQNHIPGIKIVRESRRLYPNGSLAAHIVGFVDSSNNGVAGLEFQLNKYLNGQPGKQIVEKDAVGHAFSRIDKEALSGARIVTSIDSVLQHKVEEMLAKAIDETKAESASAVVMDPATGEILALANAPTFDPSTRFSGSSSESFVRRNRAIMDAYEPGSVFKVVTYSAALEEGAVTPDDKIFCGNGQITLGSRIIHDSHSLGELTIREAFAKSSNVAAIKVSMKLGKDKFSEYVSRFGFGQKTNIELPAEAAGIVHSLKDDARTGKPASLSRMASMAMGHEVGVTAIQAVAAMAAIANNGTWIQPHLVRRIVSGDAGQRVLWESHPQKRTVVSPQTAEKIRKMLVGVVEEGTGKRAHLDDYDVAGKTGTAQKIIGGRYSQSAYVASFAGFVPASNPRYAIIVVLDNPRGAHQGGQVAAPVFNEIASAALIDNGVLPDSEAYRNSLAKLKEKAQEKPQSNSIARPAATPMPTPVLKLPTPKASEPAGKKQVPTNTESKKAAVPAAAKPAPRSSISVIGRNLREAASMCNKAGLKLQANGTGTAVSQKLSGNTLIVELR